MMRKSLACISLIILFSSCNILFKNKLQTEELSNLDNIIIRDVEVLTINKTKPENSTYAISLELAFEQAKKRDSSLIASLVQENKRSNLKNIYETYVSLKKRQDEIRPLLPLKIKSSIPLSPINFEIQEREAIFIFEDYSREIAFYKNSLSEYLYEVSERLINSDKVKDVRKGNSNLIYLNHINPNFKDVPHLIKKSEKKGQEYVIVEEDVSDGVVFPDSLKVDFWDFCNYRMPKWIQYHNNMIENCDYDYKMVISVLKMTITKDEFTDITFTRERLVKDGKTPLLDPTGNKVKSNTGKEIMTDKYKKIKAEITEYQQIKTCNIIGKIEYTNLKENRVIKTYPINVVYNFKNTYASYVGDRNAIYEEYQYFFDNKAIPYPSDDQMGYAASLDFKKQIKEIVTKNDPFEG